MSSNIRSRTGSPTNNNKDNDTNTMDVESPSAEAQGLLEEPTATTTAAEPSTSTDPNNNEDQEALLEQARQEWHDQLQRYQSHCCLLAHALALLGALLCGWWVHLLGGLDRTTKAVFNWHPLLMVLAFCFMTVAALSFRLPNVSRSTLKLIHVSSWAVAALFATFALLAVFCSHNNKERGYIANLYSFHSWLGLGVIGLYVLQFGAGFFSFLWNTFGLSPLTKAKILSIHSFLGPFLYMGVTATILLGIQEKEGFVKCGYTVTEKDWFPLIHFWEIPTPCLVSHALGIVVFATALCTTFCLHDFGSGGSRRRN